MNTTMTRFGYPNSLIRDYRHWVVLIRPVQPTPLSCVITARSNATSLGELDKDAGAELPKVIHDYETTVRKIASAKRFNYLALMMVDPNPHFHAIPRYAEPIQFSRVEYVDTMFPKPCDVLTGLELTADTLEEWRALLAAHWTTSDG
ncbi:MAG: hypothetical protein QM617_13585 [Comamonas sp.]